MDELTSTWHNQHLNAYDQNALHIFQSITASEIVKQKYGEKAHRGSYLVVIADNFFLCYLGQYIAFKNRLKCYFHGDIWS